MRRTKDQGRRTKDRVPEAPRGEPADGPRTKDKGPRTCRNDPDQTPADVRCVGEDTFTAPSQRGFALLITVTLLAFIVVLLIGLAVYTRVETAVAGNMQRQAQARENALFALNVALGQLQKHAGPDQRVTASSANFGGVDGSRHYTGVWKTNLATDDDPAKPLTWLVSGNEGWLADTSEGAAEGSLVAAPLTVTPDTVGTRVQTLVGTNSTSSTRANWVNAPLVDVTATGVPGGSPTAATTIGRYAWWVGDQGVKAPVAVADTSSAVVAAPYDSAELRSRIRQQIAIGAGATESDGDAVFEPRDGNNCTLVTRITQPSQLALLRLSGSSTTQVGIARLRQNFHTWSPNNFAVLANVKDGGLKQDLSLLPSLLGASFEAWANYPAYMEKFTPDPPAEETTTGESTTTTTTTAPTISPAYGTDPVRRRYVMTPHRLIAGGSHQVAPVLNEFGLTFRVRAVAGGGTASKLEVRVAWIVSLWNPYSAALVPQDLRVEVVPMNGGDIAPLPVITLKKVPEDLTPEVRIPLQDLFAADNGRFVIKLGMGAGSATDAISIEDRVSWLPGRVYSWRSIDSQEAASNTGYSSMFYAREFTSSEEGVARVLGDIDSNKYQVGVVGPASFRVDVYLGDTEVRIGRYYSPSFQTEFVDADGNNTESGSSTVEEPSISGSQYQFGYAFRLKEPNDNTANRSEWLTRPNVDFRRMSLVADAYIPAKDDLPLSYASKLTDFIAPRADLLLNRRDTETSYNKDVPLFELPRAPILSVGALQHFRIWNSRPFMIGNPWGVTERLNGIPLGQLFDRFYFSGMAKDVTPTTGSTGDLILPNPLLRPLRKPDGTKPTIEDIRPTPPAEETPTDGSTSTDGSTPTDGSGTGTGSTDTTGGTDDETPTGDGTTPETPVTDYVVATRSSKHLLQAAAFNLNSTEALAWAAVLRGVRFPSPQEFSYLNASSTTGTAGDTDLATVQGGEARFFRFSQSAQETFKTDDPPTDTTVVSPANTHLYRRGMRTLSGAQLTALTAKIAELIGRKHAATDGAGGPFRSVEEFLSPTTLFAGVDSEGNAGAPRSLLEAAINDSGINEGIEFSSQYLTQADIMTALAPILFARSDTFIIRAYGEAVNAAKLPASYQTGGTVPSDAIEGRAWCEAIVQRLPEFMDPSMSPESRPGDFEPTPNPDNPEEVVNPTAAQKLNKELGRRFKVISFRWLTRSDI